MEGPEDPLPAAMSEEEATVDRRGMISRAVEQVFSSTIELRETGWEVRRVCRDLFSGWGAQGFPTPEADLPSLEFLKYHREWIALKYWNMSDFPPPENQQLINPWHRVCVKSKLVLYNCCDLKEPRTTS